MSALLDEVLEAHGGAARWREAQTVSARMRTGGLIRTRFPGNRLADCRVTVDLSEIRATFTPFPADGERGVFEDGAVRIETADGELLESRLEPRRSFAGFSRLRRHLRWDAVDTTYFAGYAVWNYLSTPHLFTRDDVEVSDGDPWIEGGETWRRLEARFGPTVETHSPRQTFYFDSRGLLRRLDYTAEVIGRWARAAHYCDDHVQAGGLVFPTRRRVLPRGPRNRSLPGPTLVSVDVSELHVEPHREEE